MAVVLAAGGGTRFSGEGHKLLASFRGTTVLGASVAAAVAAGIGEVIVVVGDEDMAAACPRSVTVVVNPRWAEGQATSLAVGVAEAARRGADAVVVGLADQPLVGAGPWRAVASAPSGPLTMAVYPDGVVAPPVRLDREVWPLLPQDGDEGARALLRTRPDLASYVRVEGEAIDIDTVEDLIRWS